MQLKITNTTPDATELGFLLWKHPDKLQTFDITGGKAHVLYPVSRPDLCVAAMIMDLDSIALVKSRGVLTVHDYVNDRPFVSSSLMAGAIRKVYGSALGGKGPEHLLGKRLALKADLSAVLSRRGDELIRDLFQPLGYAVAIEQPGQLDPNFPEWGPSPYFSVSLQGDTTVKELLTHLYVLLPVLDNSKHYYFDQTEVEKLLRVGEGWLTGHPLRDLIVRRYLGHKGSLTDLAMEALTEPSGEEDGEATEEPTQGGNTESRIERSVLPGSPKVTLHDQRHMAVVEALAQAGATSALDMGCGEGKLLERLVQMTQLETIAAFDVIAELLQKARRRCGLGRRVRDDDRPQVFIGSLLYTDQRMRGFDAATAVEVIEHIEPDRLRDFEEVVFGFARPATVVLTTPNIEYNVRFEQLNASGFRHADHRFEWTRAQFREWCDAAAERYGYSVRYSSVGPDDPEVGPPSQMAVFSLIDTSDTGPREVRHVNPHCVIDAAKTLENRAVSTQILGNVELSYGNRCGAFAMISTHTVDPRWMIHLPPTMSPCETSQTTKYLEHPHDALQYYRNRGVRRVMCEQKHMGSRAIVIVCRDEAAARRRFGVESGIGACYTRMGRPFFGDDTLSNGLLDKVRTALDRSRTWDNLASDWVLLDCELMPWSVKAKDLIMRSFAGPGAAARASLTRVIPTLEDAVGRGLPADTLLERCRTKLDNATRFQAAYRPYCWSVDGLSGYRLAPFHVLASEGHVHSDKNHGWHMAQAQKMAEGSDGLIVPTLHHQVDLDDPSQCQRAIEWWLEYTASGGEGMVVKPYDYLTMGSAELDTTERRIVQPGVKCRGAEYLRIIYGLDYDSEHNLSRLRVRALKRKRWMAMQELALGLEGLERFVRGEPLQRVHECVFAVLACECEPVDPRL